MEAKQMNGNWFGYGCRSGQILFYYNKTTGEHRWPCYSKCPEKGLHSIDGPIQFNKVSSVNVGTQTDDYGCTNGCTSIYVDNDMKIQERFTSTCSESMDHKKCVSTKEVCCSSDISLSFDEDTINKAAEQSTSSSQPLAVVYREVRHKNKEGVGEKESSNFQIIRNIEYNKKQETKIDDNSLILSGSTSLVKTCVDTGIPQNTVPSGSTSLVKTCVDTGIPRSTVPSGSTSLVKTCVHTGIPRNTVPSGSTSLVKTCVDTGIPPNTVPSGSTSLVKTCVDTGNPNNREKCVEEKTTKLNYTHIIHVDAAIASGTIVRPDVTSKRSKVPADYRLIVFPDKEKVSYPTLITEDNDNDTQNRSSSLSSNDVQDQERVNPTRHTSQIRQYGCPLCVTVFDNTKTFYEHLLNHCDWKTNECGVCKKTFVKKYGLQRHVKSHASYRVHECVHCGKGFLRSTHLKTHLLTHTSGKATKCPHGFCLIGNKLTI